MAHPKLLGHHAAEEALRIVKAEIKDLEDRLESLSVQKNLLETHMETIQQQRFGRGRPLLTTLPPELFSKIVDLLADPRCACRRRACPFARAQLSLNSLTKVSRTLRRLFEPLLYESVAVGTYRGRPLPAEATAELLLRTLLERPELKDHVRYLEVREEVGSPLNLDLVATCDRVERLVVPDPAHAMRAPRSLKALRISKPVAAIALVDVIDCFQELDAFEFKQDKEDSFGLMVPLLRRSMGSSSARRITAWLSPRLEETFAHALTAFTGADKLVIENGHFFTGGFDSAAPSKVSDEKVDAVRLTHLVLHRWGYGRDAGDSFFRSLGWNGTLRRFNSIKIIEVFGSSHDAITIPPETFSELPRHLNVLKLHFRDVYMEPSDVVHTLPSIVAAWTRCPSPSPHRRLARIQVRLRASRWADHMPGFETACSAAGIELSDARRGDFSSPASTRSYEAGGVWYDDECMEIRDHDVDELDGRFGESIAIIWDDVADSLQ